MRTIHHLDRKVYASWVDEKSGDDDEDGAWLKRLRRLEKGQAYLYAPELNLFERVNVLLPDTYDATKTAVLGERVAKIGKLSKLDVKRLGEELSAVVAESEASDPVKLRARVAELERQLGIAKTRIEGEHAAFWSTNDALKKAETAPRVDKRALKKIEKVAEIAQKSGRVFLDLMPQWVDASNKLLEAALVLKGQQGVSIKPGYSIGVAPDSAAPVRVRLQEKRNGTNGHDPRDVPFSRAAPSDPVALQPQPIVGKMRTMLEVLAAGPLHRSELHTAVGMSAGGSFRAYLGRLKTASLVDENDEGRLQILSAATVDKVADMSADAILSRNANVIVGKQKDMVRVIRESGHAGLRRDELSQAIEQVEGGSFRAYVGRLKTRGIIVENGGRLVMSPIMIRGGA